ncbi:MAG: hypothetical protein COT00_04175 [Candidatus Omnitrophica bacterium CG07_land_8_20_14_0_80_50_8]|nr:MAG: hypothetical protein COT00_04175 [Candidatus Omnitrophica bacterium CG07_land_8_20_14_0_80_50_8]
MSIIHEALKKATREKGMDYSTEEKETVQRNIALEFARKKPRLNWGPIFILLVLVLVTGPIVAPIFSTPFKGANTSGSISGSKAALNVPSVLSPLAGLPMPNPAMDRKAQFAVEESPIFASSPTQTVISKMPAFNLSGVIYSDYSPKDSFCIINNKIVKVGETVEGAQLVSVSQNMAKIQYQGKEIELSVGND